MPRFNLMCAVAAAAIMLSTLSLPLRAEEPSCCTDKGGGTSGPSERKLEDLKGRVSFFNVPLVCPAAPQIACGGKAKPILLEFEKQKGVEEAWLNHAGTILALVWAKDLGEDKRAGILKSVGDQKKLPMEELKGDPAKDALNSFREVKDWHRGAQMDRLTQEEIGAIAERIVRRVAAKVEITPETAKALRSDLEGLGKRLFLLSRADSESGGVGDDPLAEIARRRLPENSQGVLREAVEQGYMPRSGEK